MTNKSVDVVNKLAKINGLAKGALIPERTRSLLWITDESPSKIQTSIMGSVYMAGNTEPNNYFSEPSLIWAQLPVTPNEELRKSPFYYPSYLALKPDERYQYLNWLRDITQPTNLSYAYLYYYGLERHLLVGDYENAIDGMRVLLANHDISVFHYAPSLVVSSLARDRLDIAERIPSITSHVTNELLALRIYGKMSLTPKIVLGLASWSGFYNKRYIELRPELFTSELQKNIDDLELKLGGSFFGIYDFSSFPTRTNTRLANSSLQYVVDEIEIPGALGDEGFKKIIFGLLGKTHKEVRIKVTAERGHSVIKAKRLIDNPPTRSSDVEGLNNMVEQLVAKRKKSPYAGEDISINASNRDLNRWGKEIIAIGRLGKTNPVRSNKRAFKLFESGYRAPDVYLRIAMNYRSQKDYAAEIELLLQMKRDFGYDEHDSRIREALRLLKRNGELSI